MILTLPSPLGTNSISMSVSPPVAISSGPLPVAAFATVNSLTALAVATNIIDSFPLASTNVVGLLTFKNANQLLPSLIKLSLSY